MSEEKHSQDSRNKTYNKYHHLNHKYQLCFICYITMDNKIVFAGHYHMANDVQKQKHWTTKENQK